jgi:hypothetical protein
MVQTVNIDINDSTWTQIAGLSEEFLAQKIGTREWLLALTTADSAPTVPVPHEICGNAVVKRSDFDIGYVWAKSVNGDAVVVVTK